MGGEICTRCNDRETLSHDDPRGKVPLVYNLIFPGAESGSGLEWGLNGGAWAWSGASGGYPEGLRTNNHVLDNFTDATWCQGRK